MQRPPRSTHTDTRFPYTTRFRCGRRGRTRRPRSFPEEAQPQVGVVHEHAVDPALGDHRPLAGVVAERPRAPAPPELREKERVLGPAGPGVDLQPTVLRVADEAAGPGRAPAPVAIGRAPV